LIARLEFQLDAFPKRAQASRGAGAQASDAAPDQNFWSADISQKFLQNKKTGLMF
jgi:hypothetical protein